MRAVAIDLDALGDTRALWGDWLRDAARRYRSIAELEPAGLPADRARAAVELDRWAESGVGDWRAALERFAEDRAPVYLRRSPTGTAALKSLRERGWTLGVFTDAPEPLARIALAHLGAAGRVQLVEAGAGALDRLLERLGDGATVVSTATDLRRLAG